MKNELDIVRDVSARLESEMNDTSPEIAAMVRDRLMAMTGSQRFIMGTQMFEAARRMVLASLPHDLSEAERKRLLFERFYGKALLETLPE